nr:response regulator [uncultured Dethiosulfovibrio sp.]
MSPSDLEFLQELRQDFLLEAEEHLQTMTSGLLELENAPKPSEKVVESVYRAAHSLKGAAHAVEMPKVASLCQSMEGIFSKLKEKTLSLQGADYDLLQRSMSCLSALIADPDQDDSEGRSLAKAMDELKSGPPKDVSFSLSGPLSPKKNEEKEPEPPDPLPSKENHQVVTGDTVRVRSAKIDSLLLQAEEMISVNLAIDQRISETRELMSFIEDCKRALHQEDLETLKQSFLSLETGIRKVTKGLSLDGKVARVLLDRLLREAKAVVMLPSSTLLQSFPKMVRDLSKTMGKDVDFQMVGGEVEVDKRILEGMKDPLIHLIRNSLDHGIEKPDERTASDKHPQASLRLSFSYTDGGQLDIILSDDGRGIDRDKLIKKAISSGIMSEEQAMSLEEEEALNLIFRSGFSTSALITDISGRGLGMAIVRENVEALGGSLSLSSELGKGTVFRIKLPLSMATFRGVLVEEGGRPFVIPTSQVIKVTQIDSDRIRSLEGREAIDLDKVTYPLARLGDILGLNRSEKDEISPFPVVVVSSSSRSFAFAVQSVKGEQEILLKGLGPQLIKVPFVSGATVMGSGKVAPVLRVKDLVQRASERKSTILTVSTDETPPSVLLVEDSITSRTLLKNILTASGYRVQTAVDGEEGFELFTRGLFDIVISDVEMPKMNGFDLARSIRSDGIKGSVPIVLVTSLDSQKDKERGVEAGADAYIVKSSFDQTNLLEIMKRLL